MKFGNAVTSGSPMTGQKHQDYTSKLIFEVTTTTAYSVLADEQDNLLEKKDTAYGAYLKAILEVGTVSVSSSLVNGRNIVSNLNLHEIALASQAYGYPVTTSENSGGKLVVNVCMPLTPDFGYIPFTIAGTLNIDLTTTAHSIQVYCLNDSVKQSRTVSQIHKNSILAGQFTSVRFTNQLAVIIEELRDIDFNFTNGHTISLIKEELDILNNMDGKIGAVSKNVCMSSYANAYVAKTDIPFELRNESGEVVTYNLKDLRFHAEASSDYYYAIAYENLIIR